MKRKFNDFSVVQATSADRDTTDLWEIRVGRMRLTFVRGREKADQLCAELNKDPYFLERGQDRMSRGGAINYPRND